MKTYQILGILAVACSIMLAPPIFASRVSVVTETDGDEIAVYTAPDLAAGFSTVWSNGNFCQGQAIADKTVNNSNPCWGFADGVVYQTITLEDYTHDIYLMVHFSLDARCYISAGTNTGTYKATADVMAYQWHVYTTLENPETGDYNEATYDVNDTLSYEGDSFYWDGLTQAWSHVYSVPTDQRCRVESYATMEAYMTSN